MPKINQTPSAWRKPGFTLVELLVVIGIISMLMALVLPAASRAQKAAKSIVCQANMRSVGQLLELYAENNNGVIFPMGSIIQQGEDWPGAGSKVGTYRTLGTGSFYGLGETPPLSDDQGDIDNLKNNKGTCAPVPKTGRWPVYVFDPAIWNPKILICPEDVEIYGISTSELHSYVLNKHLEESPARQVKNNNSHIDGTASDGDIITKVSGEIVVLGEKKTSYGDYYMETNDFDDRVEAYRHGIKLGSNYLYLDWHVATVAPQLVKDTLDPWDPVPQAPIPAPPATP